MLIYSYGLYLHAGVYVHCWKYAQEIVEFVDPWSVPENFDEI